MLRSVAVREGRSVSGRRQISLLAEMRAELPGSRTKARVVAGAREIE